MFSSLRTSIMTPKEILSEVIPGHRLRPDSPTDRFGTFIIVLPSFYVVSERLLKLRSLWLPKQGCHERSWKMPPVWGADTAVSNSSMVLVPTGK